MGHFSCLLFLNEIHFGNIFFQLPTLSEPNLMDSSRDNQKEKKEALSCNTFKPWKHSIPATP